MKKKLLFIVPCFLIVILSLLFIFVINPKILYKKDVNVIKNKITMVNNYLFKENGNINKIKEELKKESVSKNRL